MDTAKSCWGNDIGKLILRLTIGGLMLFHGISKVQNGVAWMMPDLTARGIPTWVAYGVYVGEVAAPILVIAGLFTRLGGLIIAIDMIVAIVIKHQDLLSKIDANSGGYALELQALYLFGALALVFMGGGRIGVGGLFSGSKPSQPLPVEKPPARQ